MTTKILFRVHFEDGTKLNVPADDSSDARRIAKRKYDGIVTRVKIVREKEDA
ncbi:Hypothetical protein NGAL_HAMBI1146_58370 [Neorhizobium galegae bv. officinalis]|nr:Hypothetical protein NGAL_HAMBI1146_58370 [Neorhizobium galegae bv. officinalis]